MNAKNDMFAKMEGFRRRRSFGNHSKISGSRKPMGFKPKMKDRTSLYRVLGKNGFQLIVKTIFEKGFLSVMSNAYFVDEKEYMKTLKNYISKQGLYGHSIFIDSLTDKSFHKLAAIHSTLNEKKEPKFEIYFLNNVIPRKIPAKSEEWISGIFIGDKNIEESFELTHYDHKIQGGIIEIKSNYEIPLQITDKNKKTITVGIYVRYGTRVILKSEQIIVNELNAEQKKISADKDIFDCDNELALCLLLNGGTFIWLETQIELQTHETNLTPKSLKELLFSKGIDTNIVPIIELNSIGHNGWGIQIKPVIEGICDKRKVCIEAPKGWEGLLTIKEWNALNIETYLYRNNSEPYWLRQDLNNLEANEAVYNKPIVERNVSINDWLNQKRNFYRTEDFSRIHLSDMSRLVRKQKVWLISKKHSSANQLNVCTESVEGLQCDSTTGPVYVVSDEELADHLIFTLAHNSIYGTHLFIVSKENQFKNDYMKGLINKQLIKPTNSSSNTEDSKELRDYKLLLKEGFYRVLLKAFICGKSHKIFNATPFTLNAILPKLLDNNVWVKGLLLGGIDVIRKEIKKSSKKRKTGLTVKKSKEKGRKKEKVLQLYTDWDHCIEIQSNFIIPKMKDDLPFGGNIIGIYIAPGVRCVLNNGIIDKDTYEEEYNRYKVFENHKNNPILLLGKAFLWIEGSIEFNLLEDTEICFQPLEYSLIEELIREQRIVGETDHIKCKEDLIGKVLFLKELKNKDILWSIDVSPLMFPIYENRVIYINIPVGAQIEVKDWDKAFHDNIYEDHCFQPKWLSQSIGEDVTEDGIRLEPDIELEKWIDRDFKPKIFKFLDECIKSEILIRIPNEYRRASVKTIASLKKRDIKFVKQYSDLFFLYEHNFQSDKYWFLIKYKNLFKDRFGLMKFNKNKINLFEKLFAKEFYEQLV